MKQQDSSAETLTRLVEDIGFVEHGRCSDLDVVSDLLLHDYRILPHAAGALRNGVGAYPKLQSNHDILTTQVNYIDMGIARTLDRWYRLGPKAIEGATNELH